MTHKSRTDRHGVFKLGSNVDHVTRHELQQFKVKRSKVKVTRSRNVSADKNAVTRQWIVISTSNSVGIINVGVDACGQSVKQTGSRNMVTFRYKMQKSTENVAESHKFSTLI